MDSKTDTQSPGIPSSVIDFQRLKSGGGLNFRYDLAAVQAAAAEPVSRDDEVRLLREDNARLMRRFQRAQAHAQSLQGELTHAQNENRTLAAQFTGVQGNNQRLVADVATVQAQTLRAERALQKARDMRVQSEEQVRTLQAANQSLETELQVARQALEKERARTVSAVSSIAKLKAERDVLRAGASKMREMNAIEMRASEHRDPADERDVAIDGFVEPSPWPPPSSSSDSPVVSSQVSPTISISSSPITPLPDPLAPIAPPPLVPTPSSVIPSPPLARSSSSPSGRPPLTSTSYVHRPSLTSSVPRPSLATRRTGSSTSRPSAPSSPRKSPSTGTTYLLPPLSLPQLSPPLAPAPPHAPPRSPSSALKRKRSDDADTDPDIVLLPSPSTPRPGPKPPTSKPSTPTPSKPRLGISHLPLLYETRGDTMYCRTCRHATFSAEAAWAELVGHAQTAHPEACAELEGMRPAQVVEQNHRLQYLGKR
ncbi:hypothetical protein C8R43DRAFT_215576 [Mycena crocata]|nr:hypothetical protein C8R43DRAFT_215576 [Mycena crocata]